MCACTRCPVPLPLLLSDTTRIKSFIQAIMILGIKQDFIGLQVFDIYDKFTSCAVGKSTWWDSLILLLQTGGQ